MVTLEFSQVVGQLETSENENALEEEYFHAREAQARKISAMLEKSKEEGQKQRMRITGTCLITGTVGAIVGGMIRLSSPATREGAGSANTFIGVIVMYTSATILLLGVLPTDVFAIKFANGIVGLVLAMMVFGSARNVVVFVRQELYQRALFFCLSSAVLGFYICLTIRAFYLNPRERLNQLWSILALTLLIMGAMCVFAAGYDLFLPQYESRLYSVGTYGLLFGAICGWPKFRTRAQAFLGSRGEKKRVAAAVAAALGNHSVEEAQRKAMELLRFVTLDKVSKEELAESKPNPLLFERSVAAQCGDLDAYVSHSWQDRSDEKWAALQGWRSRFKREHGREPRVWLDKFCTKQYDIDVSLMSLPIHLAASERLLILAGETFVTRMWCVMEIFVFLAAVDDVSRLEIIVLGDDPKTIKHAFQKLAVTTCECRNSDTRDKLLSIIEVGCGCPEDFDALIRDAPLFTEEDSLLGHPEA